MDASLFPVTRRKYLREKTREMVYFVSRSLRFHFLASRLHCSSYDIWETEV